MPEWVEVEGTVNQEMVNIKWDSHRNSFLQSLPQLLENEKFVDTTIHCEGVIIKCHKVSCPYCWKLIIIVLKKQ